MGVVNFEMKFDILMYFFVNKINVLIVRYLNLDFLNWKYGEL